MNNGKHNLKKITDHIKLRNTKCKRSKNLIKKCMELSTLCGLQVNLIIFDQAKNKIQEFSSDTSLKVEKIAKLKQDMPKIATRKSLKVKFISNEDIWKYMKPGDNDYDDEDDHLDCEMESHDAFLDLKSKKESLNDQISSILAIQAEQKALESNKSQIDNDDADDLINLDNIEKMFEDDILSFEKQESHYSLKNNLAHIIEFDDEANKVSSPRFKDQFFKRSNNHKKQRLEDVMKQFDNCKETESQNAIKESMACNNILDINQYINSLYNKDKYCDDSVLNVKAPQAEALLNSIW